MSLKFSMVIPTYRRPKELTRCLRGVLAQEISVNSYEIIVVDNDVAGSAKTTVQEIEAGKKKIRYEKRFSNNVSEARNLGAKIGRGEWIAFLDDDCIPGPDWLSTALKLLQEVSDPGLVFGGGYLVGSEIPSTCRQEAIYLSKNRYLVEGNCFYRRSEYLSVGGMRPDLGPSHKRFGFHEGSELQDRYLNKYGSEHKRILLHQLDVIHLETKKHKQWLAIVSGYDASFAFSSNRQKRGISNVVRILGSIGRYLFHAIKLNSRGKERELYRVGELFGESAFQAKKTYKNIGQKLRFLNNKLLHRSKKKLRERNPASFEQLSEKLLQKTPFLAGKIGGVELLALEYLDHRLRFEWPEGWSWRRPARRLHNNAGFFPIQKRLFMRWNQEMRQSIAASDFLCAWQADPFLKEYENALIQSLAPKSCAIPMSLLGREILPWIASSRWLVVSPFVKTMQRQITRLKEIHDPDRKNTIDWDHIVKTCKFVRCPFHSHLEPSPFASWEDGLDKLATEVASREFDVALIGAGAWSLPLGRRIKDMGKSAIHLGGEMQLLFGIQGKRWEYASIYNSAWVNSDPEETPEDVNRVEDGCYW